MSNRGRPPSRRAWTAHNLNLDEDDQALLDSTIARIAEYRAAHGIRADIHGLMHDIIRCGLREECRKRITEMRVERIQRTEGGL